MHGYDVAKEISRLFDGTYVPSAGVIYPTLRWLEDQGYLNELQSNERKVYNITSQGKMFLKKNDSNLREILLHIQRRKKDDEFLILQSASRLQKTIASNLHMMSQSEKARVSMYLDNVNDKITKLMLGK